MEGKKTCINMESKERRAEIAKKILGNSCIKLHPIQKTKSTKSTLLTRFLHFGHVCIYLFEFIHKEATIHKLQWKELTTMFIFVNDPQRLSLTNLATLLSLDFFTHQINSPIGILQSTPLIGFFTHKIRPKTLKS